LNKTTSFAAAGQVGVEVKREAGETSDDEEVGPALPGAEPEPAVAPGDGPASGAAGPPQDAQPGVSSITAAERGENNLKGFKGFCL